MRLMATGKGEKDLKRPLLEVVYFFCVCLKKALYEEMLTHVVDSSWNDDIYVLLRLGGEKKCLQK